MKPIVLIILLFTAVELLAAQPSVKVMALFSDKAMLQINGKNHVLKKGESINGVTLKSSSGRNATIQFSSGSVKVLGLNQSIQQAYKKPDHSKLKVYANRSGMFMLNGQINGRTTRFLLDTGASSVAMSSDEADRLNLSYESAPRGMVATASDTVPAWHITLDKVKVGGISIPNVKAMVLKGHNPEQVLLGMSFLQHLKLERDGAAMILEQKFK